MTFKNVLEVEFKGTLEEGAFVERTAAALAPFGFRSDNVIASVACCRDEISQGIHDFARQRWGLVFNLSGLGGMLFSGKTGFGAALSHAPCQEDREKYVFYAMPHIGIGADGQIGDVERCGIHAPSKACGALAALLGEYQSGSIDRALRDGDLEQSLLRARLADVVEQEQPSGLVELTRLAHDVIVEDLEAAIAQTVDTDKADYAVFSGIQIHSKPAENWVQPCNSYVVIDGKRRSIDLEEVAQ